jgi:HK97 family phage portal protein
MVSLTPWSRGARLAREAARLELEQRVTVLKATDGRDILVNSPDGWEQDAKWLWYFGPAGGDGTGGPWGNPPPGADPNWLFQSLPGVTRCTQIICDTIAGLPWLVYQADEMAAASPDWITDPQALRLDRRVVGQTPIPTQVRMSAVEFWTNWITAALWLGDGYLYVPVRDSGGAPVPPLWQLHPADVDIRDGAYWVGDVELEEGSVIHLRGEPPYWGGHGTGVLSRNAPDLGLAVTVRSYTAGQYRSGVPAGYLKSSQPHMDQDQADALKAKWMEANGGSRRSIAILNATTDFNPVQVSPVDSALDQARQWSLRDIANAFGVQPYMLGVPGDSATYANVESRMIELREFTLLPWIRRIESTLDAQFPRGTSLKIKTAGLERADTLTRYQAYSIGVAGGWLTIDDVRALEDMAPLAMDNPFPDMAGDQIPSAGPLSASPPVPPTVPADQEVPT